MSTEEKTNEKVANTAEEKTTKAAQAETAPKSGGIFGITKDTKATNNAPIPVVKKIDPTEIYPTGYEFPVASLVNVTSNPAFERKDGTKAATLTFIFRDKDKRQHMHTEWEVDPSDKKYKEKVDWLNSRLAHFYTVIMGEFPENGIGTNATSYAEYFEAIANAFNSVVKEGKKAYTEHKLFLKLVYYKDNLGFPMSPNFIEKINITAPCCKQLSINPKFDKLQPTVSRGPAGGANPGMGGDIPSELPDLDNDFV